MPTGADMLRATELRNCTPAYRRFRAQLCANTKIEGALLAQWMLAQNHLLTKRWFTLVEDGDSIHDFGAWIRWEYQRARGKVS